MWQKVRCAKFSVITFTVNLGYYQLITKPPKFSEMSIANVSSIFVKRRWLRSGHSHRPHHPDNTFVLLLLLELLASANQSASAPIRRSTSKSAIVTSSNKKT